EASLRAKLMYLFYSKSSLPVSFSLLADSPSRHRLQVFLQKRTFVSSRFSSQDVCTVYLQLYSRCCYGNPFTLTVQLNPGKKRFPFLIRHPQNRYGKECGNSCSITAR